MTAAVYQSANGFFISPLTAPEESANGSLRVRMLVSATLVLVLFLGVMGLVLDNAYRLSAEQSVSERLLLHIYALIAASDEDQLDDANSLYLPEELQEPQFNAMGSGLFGIVFDDYGREIWRSHSALDLMLNENEKLQILDAAAPGVVMFKQMSGAKEHEPLFFLSYRVIWQTSAGEAQYVYTVLQNFEPYHNEVATFRNSLWGWLIAGVFGLVAIQSAIMYWGLLPIAGLEKDLKAIEAGERAYLEGKYPSEITGVTRNLNLLLATERQQREHYRTTLADLAHSLKTPLAILQAEAARPESSLDQMSESLDAQVSRMNEIISYQLERAVTNSSGLVKSKIKVKPVLERLVAALGKVYQDKEVEIDYQVNHAVFPGDERDLMEMLGNLLDNGCKYGRRSVRVSELGGHSFHLIIEDDGPGILEADRERVLERGTRLDAQVKGQGIGLAVVAEIVHRYRGEIDIGRSALGGTRISLQFD